MTTRKTTRKPAVIAPQPAARMPLEIILAEQTYTVPPLVIQWNRTAYPICAALIAAGLFDRISEKGTLSLTGDDMDKLVELAFVGVQAAGADMSRETFDNLPISPGELFDAFLIMATQTGGWRFVEAKAA